eukprot:CAMPEP_0198118180 /NCGR_PEP_ID=MMETSP1442-20131203/20675_1 /TAXON_ID= /ORGANISM="Craspedostauros australis, Strain CCMP3328" /LENGTH=148 /DNA_ID=CAMNT_0043776397 /DNA_START=67 /DNA_END=513 /DNA_ORIENTATION=-
MSRLSLSFLAILIAPSSVVMGWSIVTPLQKAAAVATISAAIAGAPMVADAHDFTGSYADVKHPNCKREVVVEGNVATLKGTDGTPGCPADGSGRAWNLPGKIDGDSIFVDFSPKGGPKDLKGLWEPSPEPGIRWPDNNLWRLKDVSKE